MPGTSFTGSDVWVGTCTGPADTDDLTAASCIDMGVQLGNRTLWIATRLNDSYARRLIQRTTNVDDSGTDGGGVYADYGTAVSSVTWVNHSALWDSSLVLPNDNGFILMQFQGYAESTSEDFAELRLTAKGIYGPQARLNAKTYGDGTSHGQHFSIELVTPAPSGAAQPSPITAVGLQIRTEDTTGQVVLKGACRLDIWHLEKIEV